MFAFPFEWHCFFGGVRFLFQARRLVELFLTTIWQKNLPSWRQDMRISYISVFKWIWKKKRSLEIYLITGCHSAHICHDRGTLKDPGSQSSLAGSDQRQRNVEHQGCGRTPASCWLGTWKCKVGGARLAQGVSIFYRWKWVKIGEKWQWSSKGGRCGSKERKPEKLTSTSRWFHTFCFVLVMILGDGTPILH